MDVVLAADLRLGANPVDYFLIAAYFFFVIGIGVIARRQVSSSLDFFLSGRSLPAWVTGLAFISANLGAIEIMGMSANGAQYGMATMHYFWIGAVPAMLFLGVVMMPFYYGSKVRSVPEFMLRRFGQTAHLVNAISFAVAQVLIAGVNLFLLGTIVNVLLGWPLWISVIVAAIIVLTYTFLGGLTAAVYNEVLQFFVIIAALLPLTLAGLHKVGGWDGLKEKVTAGPGGAEQLSAWPADPAVRVHEPRAVGHRHRLRARLRALVRLLDDELHRGAARAREQEHVRSAADPDHRVVPETVHPVHRRDPGHDRGGLGERDDEVQGRGRDRRRRHLQRRDPAADARPAPNGMLGVAITGLLASFMAGMAANISSFNTVFSYDIWQTYVIKDRPDGYYLQVGRVMTVVACVLAIGTAFFASGYSNLMDYLQQLFSFFNAPLFATFIFGMFWKRMTPTAGWVGLVSGTLTAILIFVLNETGVIDLPGQGASFVGAGAAFVVDILVSYFVSLATKPKPDAELKGLVYSLTPRDQLHDDDSPEERVWYRKPTLLAGISLTIAIVLNIAFG